MVTTAAATIGPILAGLLSPFPVFAAVLALFTHHAYGSRDASRVLDGLVPGLAAPAIFFTVLC